MKSNKIIEKLHALRNRILAKRKEKLESNINLDKIYKELEKEESETTEIKEEPKE